MVGGAFSMGRVAGVPVRVHWSVLLIFALVATSLSAGQFPEKYPDEPAWAYGLAGVSAAVVFFLGLLAHEVSHAAVARHYGIEVTDITLWLLGGVAQLRGRASSPGVELRVAGVGPLVSLLLGAGFALLAVTTVSLGVEGLAVGTLAWLAAINLLLAVFNLLPASPLDGGRVLHAVLWSRSGDPAWATTVASRAGQVLGALLVALGVWEYLALGAVEALWLGLVGWFLMSMAGVEEQSSRLASTLDGIRVQDVMTPDPDVAPAGLTVAEFVDHYLFLRHHSTFPVVDGGRLVGLVTLRRVKLVPPTERTAVTLRDVAAPLDQVTTTGPGEPLAAVVERMNATRDRRALVLEEGELVGVVSPADVSRAVEQALVRRAGVARPPR
jgi:Zn-dependent protease/CBS domain-containing protein